MVIPGETGCLLPPKSVADMTAALEQLVRDPERRHRFGATGRERFTEQFRHQTMTRQLREIYRAVIEEQATARASM